MTSLPSIQSSEEINRFIVAFELTQEKGFDFTWPPESMRPAPYDTVLMVVEKTPRVWDEKSIDGRSEPLIASRHLRVNGLLLKPRFSIRTQDGAEPADRKEQFLVKLDRGRLRLTLSIPPGFKIDPRQKTAKIRLYEVNRNDR